MTDNNIKIPDVIEKLSRDLSLQGYENVMDLCFQEAGDGSKNLVLHALEFAYKHHAGQVRKSGEHYISHPIAAAEILVGRLGLKDPELIAAAILHDIVEDVSFLTIADIENKFGKNVARFVDGCTKLKLVRTDPSVSKDLTYKKLVLMASQSPEILLIKMADRMHNMQTLSSLREYKRQRIAQETMEVYAPLAEKLNLFSLKRDLFHLAIKQRFPKKSKKILLALNNFMESREITEIQTTLEKAYEKFSFKVTVRPRLKNLWSFYIPETKTLALENAENMVDFTVVMDTEDPLQCYRGVGLINSLFAPVPKTIRDYIANPKANGYQSLHVRIRYKEQQYLMKIRTRKMELIARKGFLAQWDDKHKFEKYKEIISDSLKNIGEYQGSPANRKNMFRQLTDDEKMFTYTPRGDIQYLPQGSIVLDFAYKLHTSLGDRCKYAWVNNRRVSLDYVLVDGDVVKVVTSDGPREMLSDIEKRCQTPKARSALNKHLQKRRDKFAAKVGKEILLQELNRYGFNESLLYSPGVGDYLTYKHYDGLEELFINVGQDTVLPGELLWEVAGIHPRGKKSAKISGKKTVQNAIHIFEIEMGVHKFSMCCHPLPGVDDAVAVLSKRGVSFHRSHCKYYVDSIKYAPEKILDVVWEKKILWDKFLRFSLHVKGISVGECMPILSKMPLNIHLYQIEKSLNTKGVEISVGLSGFHDAEIFFSCFERNHCEVSIKDYGSEHIITSA